MARVGAIERLVAQREVGDDVAFDHGLEQRPLEPRRIAQVAALDVAVGAGPDPDEHVAAKALDQRDPFARIARSPRVMGMPIDPDGSWLQDLIDQRQALLDLADADPDSRVHVAVFEHRHVELQPSYGG